MIKLFHYIIILGFRINERRTNVWKDIRWIDNEIFILLMIQLNDISVMMLNLKLKLIV